MRQSYDQQYQAPLIEEEDFSIERPAVTNLKFGVLFFGTYGLIVAIYAMSTGIEQASGSFAESYIVGGGIILGLFCAYLIFFGVLWYLGASKREILKREVIEKAIAKERAMQLKQNLE